MRRFGIIAVVAAVAFAAGSAGKASAAEPRDYFKGKTGQWIVATAPGGGFDYYARLLARHMPKHLGVPGFSYVVLNRPGAGHTIGANLLYVARPDGITIGSFTTNLVYSQVVKRKGVRFDLARMSWIGKAASDTRVLVVAAGSPYKSFADILASPRPVKFAASGAGSGTFIEAHLVGAAFGLTQQVIPGFGNTDALLAMMRGELDAQMSNSTEAIAWHKTGKARIVMQIGDRVMDGVPDGAALARDEKGRTIVSLLVAQAELARVTAGPPEMPADRLAFLRGAYLAALADPALKAEADKGGFPVAPMGGEQVRERIVAALAQPPEVVELLGKLSSAKR